MKVCFLFLLFFLFSFFELPAAEPPEAYSASGFCDFNAHGNTLVAGYHLGNCNYG